MEYKTIKRPRAATYYSVFEQTDGGEQILTELKGMFFDIQSFAPDNPHLTSFHEGQRSVLRFILNRIAAVDDEANEVEEDNETVFNVLTQETELHGR